MTTGVQTRSQTKKRAEKEGVGYGGRAGEHLADWTQDDWKAIFNNQVELRDNEISGLKEALRIRTEENEVNKKNMFRFMDEAKDLTRKGLGFMAERDQLKEEIEKITKERAEAKVVFRDLLAQSYKFEEENVEMKSRLGALEGW